MLVEPHHDGSGRYVIPQDASLGQTVALLVRVPAGSGVDRVHVRTVEDAEPRFAPARVVAERSRETWWEARVRLHNPVTSYRFFLDGAAGYGWLTATGWHRHRDVLDTGDFQLSAFPAAPGWVADAVVLQVFPDRFARSAAADDRPTPAWACAARWADPVARGPDGRYGSQLYGGDLDGVRAHLDHVAALGADVIYLTPFFPASSNHRYDASSFTEVDALLGGDEALVRLVAAAHERGIRVVGDLTTNHTGVRHEWFRRAQADPTGVESRYYLLGDHPLGYVAWLDQPSLPKLDWRDPALRAAFLHGPESVVARWLLPPFELDGWRIDVANMTGRLGDVDLTHEVARQIRATMAAVRPDAWLVAEHAHAAGPDLRGDGWHGTMNYQSVLRPLWTWLAGHEPGAMAGSDDFLGVPTGYGVPRLPATSAVAALREAAATMPWRSWVHGMNALDTHDTARFLTVVGADRARYRVGLTMLFTLPGTPMTFAGDEMGLTGGDGELARVPLPWDRPETWDAGLLRLHTELGALRRACPALRRGGLRWLAVSEDAVTYERESPDGNERILVHAARADHVPVVLASWWLRGAEPLLPGTAPVEREQGAGWRLPAEGPGVHVWRVT